MNGAALCFPPFLDANPGIASNGGGSLGGSRTMGWSPLQTPTGTPAGLVTWLGQVSNAEAMDVLGVGKKRIQQLRAGVSPELSSATLARWESYQASGDAVIGKWHLRRVGMGGCVRHAGAVYSSPLLADQVGQQVAVARASRGGLLVQAMARHGSAFRAELKDGGLP